LLELNKVLPLLAADKPDLFNAYQQTHGEKVEKAMTKAAYVASFVAHGGGKALAAAEKFWPHVIATPLTITGN